MNNIMNEEEKERLALLNELLEKKIRPTYKELEKQLGAIEKEKGRDSAK